MTAASLGILGVGHLATYTIKGLRKSGDQRLVTLSPRNAKTAKMLAEACDCTIAKTNQTVVDNSDIILLSVRPDSLDTLLAELSIKPGQLIISVIAGVSLQHLRQHPALKQATLVRALPSASAEICAGPVPLYPANPVAEALFSCIGKAVVLESEELFDTALAHACLHGWSYFLVQELIDWSVNQGMDKETAKTMVAHSISSAIAFGESRPELNYDEIGQSIATPGTYTRKGINHIRDNGGIQSWVEAMDKTGRL
ncbi:NAD(P)-binding domain-containing protein [Amphritea balenae]|uniref:Pyrroline-5-carboxylate reductase n=1 Tax=Amphritea balenae TaxID=452629 RepID=A0A3P1SWE5_9GAMM|nr:NAD(P)-binding domain-containing protein [Amphritea balenae]RRD01501.1 pyrroline-5-carboxylate reductase [Amphritea balenae]GGK56529.1 pyrroline-5-carboxylate reductase [Amphritea balenae]